MQIVRNLPTYAEPDVLVCGAGCAGTVAAVAAARRGAKVLVVEQNPYAGGYITGVIGPSFDGWVDLRSGLPVVGGIVAEFVDCAIVFPRRPEGDPLKHRYSPSNELRELKETGDRNRIRFNIEGFKRKADALFREAGVQVLYHTMIVDVIREGERVTGVVIGNKAGLSVIKPKMVIDATGDADVAAWGGGEYEVGETTQPMSLHFIIGNVKVDGDTRDQCSAAAKKAHDQGRLKVYGGPWLGVLNANSEVYVNAVRAPGIGIDPDDLTRAEIQGRLDAETLFEAFKAGVKGFEDAYLASTGPNVGVRETRRIVGDKQLTADDIENSVTQDDAITLGAWWLDRHPSNSSGYHMHTMVRPYDVGYGTIVPKGLANVWVAGRCHSVDQVALASSRVTVTCMGMGEAAGVAAATAAASGKMSRDIDIGQLQRDLVAGGSILLDRADEIRAIGDAVKDKPESRAR